MAKRNMNTDSQGKTIDEARRNAAGIEKPVNGRVVTLGRHFFSARRWGWAVRFELPGDFSRKDFEHGGWFQPVEQM